MNKVVDCYAVMLNPIAPNHWQGEHECVIGQFSSRSIAEDFISLVILFRHQTAFEHSIFAKGDAWYVELAESLGASILREEIEPKLTLSAQAHANVVAHNLKALVAKRDTLKRYTPMRRPIGLIPLGPKGGAGQLPFGVVGPLFARIKGGDLLIKRYWKTLNAVKGQTVLQPTPTHPTVDEKVV